MAKHIKTKSECPFRIKTWMHAWGDPLSIRIACVLQRTGLTPNALTIGGLVLSIGVALLLGTGHIALGGWVLLLVGLADTLDGPLARLMKRETRAGAFLDSTLDQFEDVFVFLGLLWYYLSAEAHHAEIVLIFAALSGGLLVSYVRACAGWKGIECTVGPVGRLERGLIGIVALITGHVTVGLWLLAILNNFTAAYRFLHVWRAIQSDVVEVE